MPAYFNWLRNILWLRIHQITSTDSYFNILKLFSLVITNWLDILIVSSPASWLQWNFYEEIIQDYVYTIFLLCAHRFQSLIPYLLPRNVFALLDLPCQFRIGNEECSSFTGTLKIILLHYGLQLKMVCRVF